MKLSTLSLRLWNQRWAYAALLIHFCVWALITIVNYGLSANLALILFGGATLYYGSGLYLRQSSPRSAPSYSNKNLVLAFFDSLLVFSVGFLIVFILSAVTGLYTGIAALVFLFTAKISLRLLDNGPLELDLAERLIRALGDVSRSVITSLSIRCANSSVGRMLISKLNNSTYIDSSSVENLLFLSHSFIGDAVMQTPSIAALRQLFPLARIHVITNSVTANIFKYNKNVAEIHDVLPGNFPQQFSLGTIFSLLKLRLRGYDLCVLDSEGSETAGKIIGWLAGARYLLADGSVQPSLNYLVAEAVVTNNSLHRVERSLAVLAGSSFGQLVPLENRPVLTPVLHESSAELTWARQYLSEFYQGEAEYRVGLIVGSNSGIARTKRWPLQNFIDLVHTLKKKHSRLV